MATLYREKIAKRPRRRSLLPYLLPLPLLATLVFALVHNRLFYFMVSAVGLSLYLLSAYFMSRANFYDSQAQRRKWARPSRTPWRLSAACFTALPTGLIAYFIVDQGLLISVAYGLIALIGMIFYHGLDNNVADTSSGLIGVTREELSDAFDDAEAKIESIRTSAATIRKNDSALAERLENIASGSQNILNIIENDPTDLRRARKFLKVYLEGAQQVVRKYVEKKHLQEDDEIESKLREVLNTIEGVIDQQRVKLLENDMLELDVQIEVLQKQLKHEGIS